MQSTEQTKRGGISNAIEWVQPEGHSCFCSGSMMGVREGMRGSVMVVARHVHRKQGKTFVASNEPKGRSVVVRRDMEIFMNKLISAREARERVFYETLYANYGGDPKELPWN